MPYTLYSKNCLVCGAAGARFNYQAYSCENCRVFFFRVVANKHRKLSECYANCEITHEKRRYCKSCRYKKCLRIGMNVSEVGKRTTTGQLVCSPMKRTEIVQNITIFHENVINYGSKAGYRLRMAKSSAEFIQVLCNFRNQSIAGNGKSILHSFANLNISIAELILNPGACSSRDTAVFYPVWHDPSVKEVDYRLCYARSATAFSEFMTTIDEFHKLKMNDKIALFQANFLIYTLCEVVFRQYICRKNNFTSYDYIPYSNRNTPEGYWYQGSKIYKDCTFSPIHLLLEMNMSSEEYLFLCLLAMLYNCNMLSPEGQIEIIRAREKYTFMLAEFLKLRFSPQETILRIRQILSLIKFFEEFSTIGKDKHTHMVINNIGNLDGLLSRQLHVMVDVKEIDKEICNF